MKPASTVAKVCRIIDELAMVEQLGISDLARKTALLPSDVHRLVNSLRSSGYVYQDSGSKKYQLGVQVLRVGLEACQRSQLYALSHPIVVELSQELRTTTHLGAFDRRGLDVFLIADVNGSVSNQSTALLGGKEHLHSSALGKVIIAGLDRLTSAQAIEKHGMRRNTPRTITAAEALEPHLRQVRLQGYAVDREECYSGLCCLGSPIVDWTGQPVGSISASMPVSEFLSRDEHDLAERVKTAARRISATFAFGGRRQMPWVSLPHSEIDSASKRK